MKRYLWAAILLVGIVVVSIAATTERKIAFFTENGTGSFLDSKGVPTGYSVEIVREMIKRNHNPSDIQIVPWARGYNTVLQGPNAAIFSMIRNKERENLFKWVGPLNPTKFVFIARKDSHFKFTSLEDAKKVAKIGCYKGDAREKLLIEKGFKNLDPISTEAPNSNNLKKLQLKRIDLWVTSQDDLLDSAKKYGVDPHLFEEVMLLDIVYTYIGFSKDVPDDEIKKWQDVLDEMKKDGTYVKIMKEFNVPKYQWAVD